MKLVKSKSKNNHYHRISILCFLTCLNANFNAQAANYFNPSFFSDDPNAVASLSQFENGNGETPGKYRVDIIVNQQFYGTQDIEFSSQEGSNLNEPKLSSNTLRKSKGESQLVPCITIENLATYGVNLSAFKKIKNYSKNACIDLRKEIPEADYNFDFDSLKLEISIPQAALRSDGRGYIPPEYWDQGVNALLLNYNFTGSNSRSHYENDNFTSKNYFLGLNAGINIGSWRLRDYSSWNYYNSNSSKNVSEWQHINTFLQRTIVPLKSELTLGDSNTPSDIFDSLAFRGFQLESDTNMLPDSARGFAPTIRGIAKSNAKVTIMQNGYTIYQSYVPPGPFVINDLYPTSSSGDLQVTVSETDGVSTSYTVPYAAVPILQREGQLKYSLTVGKFRTNINDQEEVKFSQGTLVWGISHGITIYGGSQVSNNYNSIALGSGFNMGELGAISSDITDARSTLVDESKHNGNSLRFLYAKSLTNSGTNFQLLGYRYSSKGFYSLDETTYKKMNGHDDININSSDKPDMDIPIWAGYYNLSNKKRGKLQLNVTQQLDTDKSLFISGSKQSYWNSDEEESLYQIGYNAHWNGISYSVSYNYSKSIGQKDNDQTFAFNVSVPLSQWLTSDESRDMTSTHNSSYATYNVNTNKHGQSYQSGGISGTLLDDNNLNYSVQQGYGNHDIGTSGNATINYTGTYGNKNLGYNYSDNGNYQQINYGLSGGVVAHREGVTFSQPLGDTNVLVSAPGANAVAIENGAGLKTDWRGYAVVPYATTYRNNRIALNTDSLGENVDIEDAVVNVVPTHGAIVVAKFKAKVGVRAIITVIHKNNPVPFGATVKSDDENFSIVGDDGQVYLSGLPLQGKLIVAWGDSPDKTCTANYNLPETAKGQTISHTKVGCQ